MNQIMYYYWHVYGLLLNHEWPKIRRLFIAIFCSVFAKKTILNIWKTTFVRTFCCQFHQKHAKAAEYQRILSLSLCIQLYFKTLSIGKKGLEKRYSGQYWFATGYSALFMQCKHSCIGCKCTDFFFLLSNSCFLLYFESACIYKYAPFWANIQGFGSSLLISSCHCIVYTLR